MLARRIDAALVRAQSPRAATKPRKGAAPPVLECCEPRLLLSVDSVWIDRGTEFGLPGTADDRRSFHVEVSGTQIGGMTVTTPWGETADLAALVPSGWNGSDLVSYQRGALEFEAHAGQAGATEYFFTWLWLSDAQWATLSGGSTRVNAQYGGGSTWNHTFTFAGSTLPTREPLIQGVTNREVVAGDETISWAQWSARPANAAIQVEIAETPVDFNYTGNEFTTEAMLAGTATSYTLPSLAAKNGTYKVDVRFGSVVEGVTDGAAVSVASYTASTTWLVVGNRNDDHANSAAGATSIAVGGSWAGAISYWADVDYFKFDAVAGKTYAIATTLSGGGAMDDSLLRLYDAGGTLLAWNDDWWEDGSSRIVWTAAASGPLTVAVDSAQLVSAGGQGSYTLSVEELAGIAPKQANAWLSSPAEWFEAGDGIGAATWTLGGETAEMMGRGMEVLQVMDLGNPASPVGRGKFFVGSCEGTAVSADGKYIYVVDDNNAATNGFSDIVVLDVTNRSLPSVVNRVRLQHSDADSLAISGPYLLVGSQDSNQSVAFVEMYSLADPKLPALYGQSAGISSPVGGPFGPNGINIYGETVFLLHEGEPIVTELDVTAAGTPVQTHFYHIVRDGASAGGMVNYEVWDITNNQLEATVGLAGIPRRVVLDSTLIYLPCQTAGLAAVDKTTFQATDFLVIPNMTSGVALNNGYLYVPTTAGRLGVFKESQGGGGGPVRLLNPGQKATFSDIDGDMVTVSFAGSAGSQLRVERDVAGDGPGLVKSISLAAADPKAAITVTVVKPTGGTGNGTVDVGSIDVAAAKSITAGKVIVGGDVKVPGLLASLTLGDVVGHAISIGETLTAAQVGRNNVKITLGLVRDSSLNTFSLPIGSLTVTEWRDTDATADELRSVSLATLSVKGAKANALTGAAASAGNFEPDVILTGAGLAPTAKTMTTAAIAGGVDGSWHVSGLIGTVGAGGAVNGWSLLVDDRAAVDAKSLPVTVKGAITSLKLGNVERATVAVSDTINSVQAVRWANGQLSANRVATLKVTGLRATTTAPAVAGDLGAEVELRGMADGKKSLDSADVAGRLGQAGGGAAGFTHFGITGSTGTIKAGTLGGNVTVSGALAGLTAGDVADGVQVNVAGGLAADKVGRNAVKITLGRAGDMAINTNRLPISSLTVTEWRDENAAIADTIRAASIGTLSAKGALANAKAGTPASAGNFEANVQLTGDGLTPAAKTLNSTSIAGGLGGTWNIAGLAGAIGAKGAVNGWTLNVTDRAATDAKGAPVTVKGTVASMSLGDVTTATAAVSDAINSITAVRWAGGSIDANRVGTLRVNGLRATAKAAAVSGDLGAAVTLRGTGDARKSLDSATVAGQLGATGAAADHRVMNVTGTAGTITAGTLAEDVYVSGVLGGVTAGSVLEGVVIDAGESLTAEQVGRNAVRLSLGRVSDASVDTHRLPISLLAVIEWESRNAAVADQVTAASIGTLSASGARANAAGAGASAGNFAAAVNLTGNGLAATAKTLTSANVAGTVNGPWNVAGQVGTVGVKGEIDGWSLTVTDRAAVDSAGAPVTVKGAVGTLTMGLARMADVSVSDAINSVQATRWGNGSLAANRVGTLNIAGRAATTTAAAVTGDLGAQVTLRGTGDTRKTLDMMNVAGQLGLFRGARASTFEVTGPAGLVKIASVGGKLTFHNDVTGIMVIDALGEAPVAGAGSLQVDGTAAILTDGQRRDLAGGVLNSQTAGRTW